MTSGHPRNYTSLTDVTVHCVDDKGTAMFNHTIRWPQLLAFFRTFTPCIVSMEACRSAHHWVREIQKFGHEVRLTPAFYVKPYVKRGKTDAVDTDAICEAATRPTMRFTSRR